MPVVLAMHQHMAVSMQTTSCQGNGLVRFCRNQVPGSDLGWKRWPPAMTVVIGSYRDGAGGVGCKCRLGPTRARAPLAPVAAHARLPAREAACARSCCFRQAQQYVGR